MSGFGIIFKLPAIIALIMLGFGLLGEFKAREYAFLRSVLPGWTQRMGWLKAL